MSKTLVLPNKDRLKVSNVPILICEALYPDDVPLLSDEFFNVNSNGERVPLLADPPFMMRFIAKPRIEENIRNLFDLGELRLICPISQGFVLKDYVDRTNPFNCLITFDDFVKFAAEYDVCIKMGHDESGKKTKNQQRDDDFRSWIAEENPDLDTMTKSEINAKLLQRNSRLFASGFDDWWKQQNIHKGTPGRKPA